MYHSDYLSNAITNRPVAIKRVLELIQRHSLEFDTVAVRGLSGVLVGVPVADQLAKNLIIARKDGEQSHGRRLEWSSDKVARYIIVDDFVCGGNTVRSIMDGIKRDVTDFNDYRAGDTKLPLPECVGIVTYQDGHMRMVEGVPVYEWKGPC